MLEDAVRRVGVRRLWVVRCPDDLAVDRVVVVLRRVVRRPVFSVVDSDCASGSIVPVALRAVELEEDRVERARLVVVVAPEPLDPDAALRLRSDHSPVKNVLFNRMIASATFPASLDRLLSNAATSTCLPWFLAV